MNRSFKLNMKRECYFNNTFLRNTIDSTKATIFESFSLLNSFNFKTTPDSSLSSVNYEEPTNRFFSSFRYNVKF